MITSGTFTKLRPLSLLRHLSSCSENTCLNVFSNSVTWFIYLEQGKITYASHSIEPFDRLERHLRRLSHQIPSLTNETRVQLRLMFEHDSPSIVKENREQPSEYKAICWLASEGHIDSTQAAVLIQELAKEVIESLLLIKQGTYQLGDQSHKVPRICRIDVDSILEYCQERLSAWRYMNPVISSPYQRPYLCIQTKTQQTSLAGLEQNLTNWIKGFSLRHLAVITNQDELEMARNLYPYILNGAILLHEPDPPFDQLPNTCEESSRPFVAPKELSDRQLADKIPSLTTSTTQQQDNFVIPTGNIGINHQFPKIPDNQREEVAELTTPNNTSTATLTPQKVYKIVSVDDSPSILKEISRLLQDENFSVVTINDSIKAVMSIIRHKPDLILLDLNMAGIDGYQLCRIIRNNSIFKKTPIIMVTGNKGIVDKVRARLVGASGYLTKPFTGAELLKIVFMHLT